MILILINFCFIIFSNELKEDGKKVEYNIINDLIFSFTDLVPCFYLFRIHYTNFLSFSGNDILNTTNT